MTILGTDQIPSLKFRSRLYRRSLIVSGFVSGPGNSVQTAYTDFDVIAPSWGRSDGLHYFRKSCCLSDMLNYSKEP